jgi:hypothetical protein
MTKRDWEERDRMFRALEAHGVTEAEFNTLRRASMTLRRWAERECNGEIERDETTGKVYAVNAMSGERRRWTVADRETPALARCKAIAAAHGLTFYHQSDPRGAAVWILRPGDVPAGAEIGSYCTRGIAVY